MRRTNPGMQELLKIIKNMDKAITNLKIENMMDHFKMVNSMEKGN